MQLVYNVECAGKRKYVDHLQFTILIYSLPSTCLNKSGQITVDRHERARVVPLERSWFGHQWLYALKIFTFDFEFLKLFKEAWFLIGRRYFI
jgi:hypothetical protein